MDYHRYRPVPVYDMHGPGKLVPASDRMVPLSHNGSPRLVALSGPAGCGKSTASAALTDTFEGDWVRVKFADALKDMLRALYLAAGLDDDEIEAKIEGHLKETPCPILRGRSPRHAMITLGTEWGRDQIAHDLWVRIWRRRVSKWMDLGMNVVVDDLRFENEAEMVRELGGTIIRLEGRGGLSFSHASENGNIVPDHIVVNNGRIEDLCEQVREAAYAT